MNARWYNKANAFAAAWKSKFGVDPSMATVALGLSVAQHETRCGDAWPGEYNWGAVQHRVPNTLERAVLSVAGPPNPKAVGAAREALTAAIAAGTIPAPVQCALHVDSSPGKGWYWVFFWSFDNDEQGAAFFIRIIAENRAACRAALENATLENLESSATALATQMYRSRYYEGFHNPKEPGGVQANIDDYAGGLQRILPGIVAGLKGWGPGATLPPPDPNAIDLSTLIGIQMALNKLGAKPALTVDGITGPKTKAAIKAFQASKGLTDDGIVGPKTLAALELALR